MDERRRYFRIEDKIGLHHQLLSKDEALERQALLDEGEFGVEQSLQEAERQIQMLVDKLRVQNPEFAEAIDLLNTKFNLLKSEAEPGLNESKVIQASLSACGVSVPMDHALDPGQDVYLDITLLPTDLHVKTLSKVVECHAIEDEDRWLVSMDFTRLKYDMEELLVQHVVKRQGRLLAEQRRQQA